jgi:hypothetical protein
MAQILILFTQSDLVLVTRRLINFPELVHLGQLRRE